jgi:predicted AAA+ superfamily ATPase
VYYWANGKNTAEVEFVVQYENKIIPIEVKAGKNIKARSLASYREQFKPETAVRASLADYGKNKGLVSIPLYAAGAFHAWL